MKNINTLVKESNNGNAKSAFQLGLYFWIHKNNPFIVQRQLLKAAKSGYSNAQFCLGLLGLNNELYKSGTIFDFDYNSDKSVGIYWLEQASSSGHLLSEYVLAQCMFRGVGIKKDEKKAQLKFTRIIPCLDEQTMLAISLFFNCLETKISLIQSDLITGLVT